MKSKQAELSEIEGCVLALALEQGPATPYVIRKDFRDSPTPQWSGSAGTIYPLVKRLMRRGLIRSKIHRTGDRKGQLISLTPAGRRAFERWLSVPVSDWVAGIPADPLRTRIRFLGSMTPAKRRAFVEDALANARRQLDLLVKECEKQQALGPFQGLMARGGLLVMESRLAFLEEVLATL